MITLHGEEVTANLVREYLNGSRGDLEHDVDTVTGASTLYSEDGAVSFASSDAHGMLLQVYGEEGTVVSTARVSVTISDRSDES